jgi:hypothetical protein
MLTLSFSMAPYQLALRRTIILRRTINDVKIFQNDVLVEIPAAAKFVPPFHLLTLLSGVKQL